MWRTSRLGLDFWLRIYWGKHISLAMINDDDYEGGRGQKKDKCQGAVAWCSVCGSGNEGLVKVFASSAIMTKALAVLCTIIWAKPRRIGIGI
ncbi:hypothetical protein RHMOL_Rhmol11G0098100 [Rhododendron molle]|uniref:Uncharacterized protein n=1 Tax=Rhododendron molle TaxID=49168 RepID=A0ACC0LRE5_RHOML|nr:hypothetical protein RHMOL_Rhmol11G0098100 [Rhododendron molle]